MHWKYTGLFKEEVKSGQIILCFSLLSFLIYPSFHMPCFDIGKKNQQGQPWKSLACVEYKEVHSTIHSVPYQGRPDSDLEAESVYIDCWDFVVTYWLL